MKYILLLLLFAVPVSATITTIGSSDLPYTASSANDTIRFNASKITTTGNGIYVTANNVTIDLQNDTLEFGTGGANTLYGINMAQGVDDLTITANDPHPDSGGYIIVGDSNSWDCVCVRTYGVSNIADDFLMTNVKMIHLGWDGHCFWAEGIRNTRSTHGGYTFRDCRFYNYTRGFTSRSVADGIAIYVTYGDLTVEDSYIYSFAHGIKTSGYPSIVRCTIIVDAKNDLYERPSGQIYWRSAGYGGIGIDGDGGAAIYGGEVRDNVILCGLTWDTLPNGMVYTPSINEGLATGIQISHASQTGVDDSLYVTGNYINIHRGLDDYEGSLTTHPFKLRWQNKYVVMRDNDLICYNASADSGISWGASGCVGYHAIWTSSSYGSEGAFLDSFMTFEENRIISYALDNTVEAVGIKMVIRGENDSPVFDFTGAGNVWRNNYIGASNSCIEFGHGDGGPCQSVLIVSDTLDSLGNSGGDFYTYEAGDYWGNSENNTLRDMVYLNDIPDTLVAYDSYALASWHKYEKTIKVNVYGNNGLLIANADVEVFNQDSSYADTISTGALGYIEDVVSYYFAHGTSTVKSP